MSLRKWFNRAIIVSCALSNACLGQSSENADATTLLEKAISIIRADIDDLPKLSCVESVERSSYAGPKTVNSDPEASFETNDRALAWTDRFRLQFAVFNGRQLFSWPGSGRFKYEIPSELVGNGAATAGEFGPFAIDIFLSGFDLHALRFAGWGVLSGREVAYYRYEVPQERSHFLVTLGDNKRAIPTAFRGVISINRETGEVKRLVVDVVHPPAETEIVRGRIVTDYAPIGIGSTTTLAPEVSTLRLVGKNNGLSVNQTRYSDCREFIAESTLTFDPARAATVPGAGSRTSNSDKALPPGLNLVTTLLTTIDAERSFAGDLVTARVNRPAFVEKEVVVPKGSLLFGRLVNVRRQFRPDRQVTLRIQFDHLKTPAETIEIPVSLGSLGPSIPPVAGPSWSPPAGPADRQQRMQAAVITIFGRDRFRLKAGSQWIWQTR